MYTQCPECLSVFSLDARKLAQAHGFVRCGHCDAGFDSIATLTEQLPPVPFQLLPSHEPGMQPPLLAEAIYRPPPPPAPTPVPEPPSADIASLLDETETAEEPASDAFADLKVTPRFARQQVKPRRRRWPWVLASLILLIGLGSQLVWAMRDNLLRDPRTAPLLNQLCTSLHCELPQLRDPSQLHLLARDVQTHPSVPGALLITATIRNDAPFTQPWPVVDVKLNDANGKVLAMRRLSPAQYLDDNALRRRGLPPGASSALVLEVEDPGRQAVAFDLGFE